MTDSPSLQNSVREARTRRGWSQEDLARRAGLSRSGVSAIESGRLVPSAAAALGLAGALDARVEDLFWLGGRASREVTWAWSPPRHSCRYWEAEVGGRPLRFPVEASPLGVVPHDGVDRGGPLLDSVGPSARETIVMACCDPAVGLLASELAHRAGIRLIVLPRSSGAALTLLRSGLVHAAGVHLSAVGSDGGNAAAVRGRLGPGHTLLRMARWEEGIATAPGSGLTSVRDVLRPGRRWVGREEGSGARQCLDELLEGGPPPRRLATDHRGVAEAVRCGWAEAGVCLRLASEEVGLGFLAVREEPYDLCFATESADDPRLRALIGVVQSASYRGLVDDLPGYDGSEAGVIERLE
jgi:molybdate-binding protein/transcriptional regulator with XRE-family HTH domain